MLITNSINPNKVILAADISEYNLLIVALMAFRDSAIDPSMCDGCVDHGEAIREHAAEVVDSLVEQEKGIPALAHDDDCDEPAPDWISDDNDNQDTSINIK